MNLGKIQLVAQLYISKFPKCGKYAYKYVYTDHIST